MSENIQKIIDEKESVLLYFWGDNCGVCKALRPKIDREFSQSFPDMERLYVNAEENKELAANFSVFTIPTVLVFLQGKEFARESRNMSVDGLIEKVTRPYSIMKS